MSNNTRKLQKTQQSVELFDPDFKTVKAKCWEMDKDGRAKRARANGSASYIEAWSLLSMWLNASQGFLPSTNAMSKKFGWHRDRVAKFLAIVLPIAEKGYAEMRQRMKLKADAELEKRAAQEAKRREIRAKQAKKYRERKQKENKEKFELLQKVGEIDDTQKSVIEELNATQHVVAEHENILNLVKVA